MTVTLPNPTGSSGPLKTHLLQLRILSMHQNGRWGLSISPLSSDSTCHPFFVHPLFVLILQLNCTIIFRTSVDIRCNKGHPHPTAQNFRASDRSASYGWHSSRELQDCWNAAIRGVAVVFKLCFIQTDQKFLWPRFFFNLRALELFSESTLE